MENQTDWLEIKSPNSSDWLEFEILCLVKDHFSLEARIARARHDHRKRSHLIHFQKMVKTLELAAA